MAFRDFSFPQVQHDLGLTVRDADLFSEVAPAEISGWFPPFLHDGVQLAHAIATEKAKSEFIIAPVLLECCRSVKTKVSIFSGVEWNVDMERGLNGVCDFILTKGPTQYILSAPFIAVVEAKNDSIPDGLGQCIAAMVAAQISNAQEKNPIHQIHGIVSTGSVWQFLRLQEQEVIFDRNQYYIDNLPKIMGILHHIVQSV
jgi:hypothetical protein